jgi:hypothetical protein
MRDIAHAEGIPARQCCFVPRTDLILQRVHPEDMDLLKGVLERAGRGGSDFDFEHRLLMPDGSINTFEVLRTL